MSAQDDANQAAMEFACNSAAELALLAVPDAPSFIINGVPGPAVVPPYHSPPGTRIFYNSPQTCAVTCPDASLFTFTCPPGRFSGASQAQANAIAMSYACQQAALRKVCPPATPCTITDVSPLAPFDQGQPYSHQFTASGGTPPLSWSIIAGSLPTGLSMNGNGFLSGTAALVNGNLDKTFTVRAADSANPQNVCTKVFSLPVLDYHDFPPGKKWRIQGYLDGMISGGCCVGGVGFAWSGNFSTQFASAVFTDNAVAIGGIFPIKPYLRPAVFGPPLWSLEIGCLNNAVNAAWVGQKAGSNAGAKLDSPAGVYQFNNYFGYTAVCDATPTLTIEEY